MNGVHPAQRGAGALLIVAALLLLDYEAIGTLAGQPLLQLAVYGMLIAGAILVTRAVLAVAVATCLLATAHASPGAPDWLSGMVYPALAVIAASICVALLTGRFRVRMRSTHDARWARRRDNTEDDPPDP